MEDILVYGSLFLAAFLAATLLPAQSEAVLLGLVALDRYPAMLLLAVASTGNVLGSCVNYAVGRFLTDSGGLQRFVNPAHQRRAENWYRRYGKWSLLASWFPVVGDPLTLVAGALREPLGVFLLIVTVAKTGRYVVLMAIQQAWFG